MEMPFKYTSDRGIFMERSEYRNRNIRRRSRGKQEQSAIKEVILTQCIVSGVILFILMLSNLIRTDFTTNIRSQLKIAITNQMTVEDAIGIFSNLQNSFGNIFGNTAADSENEVPRENNNETVINGVMADFRIDEDILEMMNLHHNPYGGEEPEKKPETTP